MKPALPLAGDRYSADLRYAVLARLEELLQRSAVDPARSDAHLSGVGHLLVDSLTDAEVDQVKRARPELSELFEPVRPRLAELVCNPFNLNMAAELLSGGPGQLDTVHSQVDLLRLYWDERVATGWAMLLRASVDLHLAALWRADLSRSDYFALAVRLGTETLLAASAAAEIPLRERISQPDLQPLIRYCLDLADPDRQAVARRFTSQLLAAALHLPGLSSQQRMTAVPGRQQVCHISAVARLGRPRATGTSWHRSFASPGPRRCWVSPDTVSSNREASGVIALGTQSIVRLVNPDSRLTSQPRRPRTRSGSWCLYRSVARVGSCDDAIRVTDWPEH